MLHATHRGLCGTVTTLFALLACDAIAAGSVSRLTPPSELFRTNGVTGTPVVSSFVPGQRFDLQATIRPDDGAPITAASFQVDGQNAGTAALLSDPAKLNAGLPSGTTVATLRAYSNPTPGLHTFSVTATQANGQQITARGNFEVRGITMNGAPVKNIIIMLGDGMGATHRTAARIMSGAITQGKVTRPLAMDAFTNTAMIMTSSLNSIVTDSAPGMASYVTGNKSDNNQEGVFPDDTIDPFDNPRVEYLAEYLARTSGKKLGIVTTADVFDATPAANAVHTANRGAGTGIVDQYFDDRAKTGLTVLMGGGRKWFLPRGTVGSQRANSSDYVLPAELATAWGVAAGKLDEGRDLVADFVGAGWQYAPDRAGMTSAPINKPLLGLFAFSNMNVAFDKVSCRRGLCNVVNDYGFPDQPMLDEMVDKALQVLDNQSPNGFVLMAEGASIDKQAHNMDSERWIVDTIEFDRAIAVAKRYAETHPDTIVIVTADHECAGAAIIGASKVDGASLATRAASGAGTAAGGPRNGVVGTYDAARFPVYPMHADGYPIATDVSFKMLIGYGANADRYEDWMTNAQPLRDSQQPLNGSAPLNTYPSLPIDRDKASGFFVTGQVEDSTAAHTASDIPLSAFGRGASAFFGTMDNTDVFFKLVQLAIGGQ